MLNIRAYTIEIKVEGTWWFYKRVYNEETANSIMKAFGDNARLSIHCL